MAVEVVMPRLGWTMETGKIAEWLKKDGDMVQTGDIIFTVESDKALQEVEALESGILRVPPWSAPAGTETPVGAVLAYLTEAGEAIPAAPHDDAVRAPSEGQAAVHHEATATSNGASGARSSERGAAAISPRARRVAGELGIDWTTITGSGRTGRIVERDVRARAAQSTPTTPARITPLARRIAQDAGVDVNSLAAQLPGKRIGRSDVEIAVSGADETTGRDGDARPISAIRRITAGRMAHSAHTAAPVTLTTEADATELVRLRERMKAAIGSGRAVPSYNDLLTRLVALALLEHPWMNSSLSDDTIIQHGAVHMGIAVDTDHGLLVPVVRDADKKSIQDIAAKSAWLIERARSGKADPDDLRGGTFTITNLGIYDIDAFTPIINLPECAILGVGRIVARPIVVDEESGEIAARKMMSLSLTFDHRLVDGAPAARFLRHVTRWIEEPYAWLTF